MPLQSVLDAQQLAAIKAASSSNLISQIASSQDAIVRGRAAFTQNLAIAGGSFPARFAADVAKLNRTISLAQAELNRRQKAEAIANQAAFETKFSEAVKFEVNKVLATQPSRPMTVARPAVHCQIGSPNFHRCLDIKNRRAPGHLHAEGRPFSIPTRRPIAQAMQDDPGLSTGKKVVIGGGILLALGAFG